jgi:hypothetical protein
MARLCVSSNGDFGAITMTSDSLLPSSGDGPEGAVVRVDRRHALRLTGEAADEVCDTLGRATREGLRLARAARPGDVFELVPPADLAKGIKDGTLRAATPTRGDASVLVKNVKDGQIAGRSDLRRVKPTAVDVIGPAAWQAMALATQQHYLAEISSKLDGLKAGVDEVLARLDDDRIGALNDISEVAADAQAAARRDGRLSAERVSDLRRAAADAKRLWHQIATTSRRHLAQYQEGTASAEDAEQTFAMLAHATRVLAQCSDALVAIPRATAGELEAAVAEEQDRIHPALPEFVSLSQQFLDASNQWRASHELYEASRPKNRVARALHLPPVEVRRVKGKLETSVSFKPEQQPLTEARQDQVQRLVAEASELPPSLVVEVDAGGAVLLGPATPAAR